MSCRSCWKPSLKTFPECTTEFYPQLHFCQWVSTFKHALVRCRTRRGQPMEGAGKLPHDRKGLQTFASLELSQTQDSGMWDLQQFYRSRYLPKHRVQLPHVMGLETLTVSEPLLEQDVRKDMGPPTELAIHLSKHTRAPASLGVTANFRRPRLIVRTRRAEGSGTTNNLID